MYADGQRLLDEIVRDRLISARGAYGFWPAASDRDDIVVFADDDRAREVTRFPMLRQQDEMPDGGPNRSLVDFIAPLDSGVRDYLGAFAVTAGVGVDALVARYQADHDDYKAIMVKALADRLAEAMAEWLHARVRREWGYGVDEALNVDDLRAERYRGIRPAFGYPCVSRSQREATAVLIARRRSARPHADRDVCDGASSQRERFDVRSPTGQVLLGRPRGTRPGGIVCFSTGHVRGRRRALAGPESGVLSEDAPVKNRCPWPTNDPLYLAYHDEEWGVPCHDDRHLFEMLILEGAQAGLSWITILRKRDRYREVFDNFDPAVVARYDARKEAALLADAGIVRNRLKIQSAITNAKAFLAVQREFGSFDAYVWRLVGGRPLQNAWASMKSVPARTAESDALSKDLKKRGFRFVGSTICYAFMQAVGLVNDHVPSCDRHAELSAADHRSA